MEPEKTNCRKKGQGTLFLKGNNYMAIWTVNGKRYTRSTKTNDRAEAEKKLAEFVKPFQENSELEIAENLLAKVRVQETKIKDTHNKAEKAVELKFLIDTYKDDISTSAISANTERVYNTMIDKFTNAVDKVYVHDVTKHDVEKFMEKLKKDSSESTYNRYLVVLRKMFDVAMRHDYRIKHNPFEGFKKLKQPKDVGRRELTFEEVEKLIKCAEEVSEDAKSLFIVGAYTGMRKSDICNLKWESVDLKNSMIRYLPIKTKHNGRKAVVPIHPKVAEVLDNTPKSESGYVFDKLKSMYETGGIEYQINTTFAKAGIAKSSKDANGKVKISTGFHALRVFFATQCARSGTPVSQIMKMLAHSKVDMSMHYVLTQENDLSLPDFDDSHVKMVVKKETFEAIEKARGPNGIDEFLMALLEGGNADIGSVQTWRDRKAIDKMIDEVLSEDAK